MSDEVDLPDEETAAFRRMLADRRLIHYEGGGWPDDFFSDKPVFANRIDDLAAVMSTASTIARLMEAAVVEASERPIFAKRLRGAVASALESDADGAGQFREGAIVSLILELAAVSERSPGLRSLLRGSVWRSAIGFFDSDRPREPQL